MPSLANWVRISSVSCTVSLRKVSKLSCLNILGIRDGGNMHSICWLVTLANVEEATVISSEGGMVLLSDGKSSGMVSTTGGGFGLVPFFFLDLEPLEWRLLDDLEGIVVKLGK